MNDAFLDLINWTDGSEGSLPEGNGMCENLRQYSKVKMEERLGKVGPPSLDPESDECREYLTRRKAATRDALHWKDNYLLFRTCVRAGATQKVASALGGVCKGRMSDIFYEWA